MATTRAANQASQTVAPSRPVIALDPHRHGRQYARLVEEGKAVWVLIAHLQGNGGDIADTAAAYGISEEAVSAAVAYYEADPRYIDAHLLLSRESFNS